MVTQYWGTVCKLCGFPFFVAVNTKKSRCPSCMKYNRIIFKKKRNSILKEFESKNDAIWWKGALMELYTKQRINEALNDMKKEGAI